MNNFRGGRDSASRYDQWKSRPESSVYQERFTSNNQKQFQNESRDSYGDVGQSRDDYGGGRRRNPSPLMSRKTVYGSNYENPRKRYADNLDDSYDSGRGNESQYGDYTRRNNQSGWDQNNRSYDRNDVGRDSYNQNKSDYYSQGNDDFRRDTGGQSDYEINRAKRPRLSSDNTFTRNSYNDGNNQTSFAPDKSYNRNSWSSSFNDSSNRMSYSSQSNFDNQSNRNSFNDVGNNRLSQNTIDNSYSRNSFSDNGNRSNFSSQNKFDSYNDNNSGRMSSLMDYKYSRNNRSDDFNDSGRTGRNSSGSQRNNSFSNWVGNRSYENNQQPCDFSDDNFDNRNTNAGQNFNMNQESLNVGNTSQMTPVETLLNSIANSGNLPRGLDVGADLQQLGNLVQTLPQAANLQINSPSAIIDLIASSYQMQLAKQTAGLLQGVVSSNFQNYNIRSPRNTGISLEALKNHSGPFGFLIVYYICEEHPLTTLSKTASLFKKKLDQSFTFDKTTKKWVGKIRIGGKLVKYGEDANQYVCKLRVAKAAVQKLTNLYYTILYTKNFGGTTIVNHKGEFVPRKKKLPGQKGGSNKDDKEEANTQTESWHGKVANLEKLKNIIVEYKDDITNINDLVFSNDISVNDRARLERFALNLGLNTEKVGGGEKNRYLVVTKKNDIMNIVYNLAVLDPNPKNGKYRLLRPGQDFRSTGIPKSKIEFQPNPKKMMKGEKKDEPKSTEVKSEEKAEEAVSGEEKQPEEKQAEEKQDGEKQPDEKKEEVNVEEKKPEEKQDEKKAAPVS